MGLANRASVFVFSVLFCALFVTLNFVPNTSEANTPLRQLHVITSNSQWLMFDCIKGVCYCTEEIECYTVKGELVGIGYLEDYFISGGDIYGSFIELPVKVQRELKALRQNK